MNALVFSSPAQALKYTVWPLALAMIWFQSGTGCAVAATLAHASASSADFSAGNVRSDEVVMAKSLLEMRPAAGVAQRPCPGVGVGDPTLHGFQQVRTARWPRRIGWSRVASSWQSAI